MNKNDRSRAIRLTKLPTETVLNCIRLHICSDLINFIKITFERKRRELNHPRKGIPIENLRKRLVYVTLTLNFPNFNSKTRLFTMIKETPERLI